MLTITPKTADWSDLCVRLDGDEIQSDQPFTCACGHTNEGAIPRFFDGYWARTCPICDQEYLLHDWSPRP